MASTTPKVCDSLTCINTFQFYHDQLDLLLRNEKDLKNDVCNVKKNNKPLREKVEAQAKDLSRIKEKIVKSALTIGLLKKKLPI